VVLELKYFRKISEYEDAEARPDLPPLPPFSIESFGLDSNIKRAKRELTRLLMLAGLWFLREFWPLLRIGRTVIVTRYDDVMEVLKRSDDFQVPYGPEMRSLTGGKDFALGMDGPAHAAQRNHIMAAVVQKTDAPRIVEHTRFVAENLVRTSGGRIDVMRDLLARTMMEACDEYFGLGLDEPNSFLDRTFANSALLFADPFGDSSWRRQTLSAASYNRYVVDRATDRAIETIFGRHPRPPVTVIERLVAQYGTRTAVDRDEIRAMAIGTITGLVPTNTLGAAKMLEEIKRRPLVFEDVKAIAATWRDATTETARDAARNSLQGILWEVARLNPGLQPGQWRHAPRHTDIGGRPVRAGSVLMVATMSALRDRRHFGDFAGYYDPDRRHCKDEPRLMFGAFDHECLGTYLGMAQITEVFLVLFSQKNVRWSQNREGWLTYFGPFPRRLDMEFDDPVSPQHQEMITIQVPVRPDVDLEKLQAKIDKLGNPPCRRPGGLGQALRETNLVHFASLSAFDARDPDDAKGRPDPRVVLELNVDGDADRALETIVKAARGHLEPIFEDTVVRGFPLLDALKRQTVTLDYSPWGNTGLNFNGTPDCAVADIEVQQKIAEEARKHVDAYVMRHGVPGTRALGLLNSVRRTLKTQYSRDTYAKHLIRPTRRRLAIAEWSGTGTTIGFKALFRSSLARYVTMLIMLPCLALGALIYSLLPAWGASWGPHVAAVAAIGWAGMLALSGLARPRKEKLSHFGDRIGLALAHCVVWTAALTGFAAIVAVAGANTVGLHFLLVKAFPAIGAMASWTIAAGFGIAALRPEYRVLVALLDMGRAARGVIRTVVLAAIALGAVVIGWYAFTDPGPLATKVHNVSYWLHSTPADAAGKQLWAWVIFYLKAMPHMVEIVGWLAVATAGGILAMALVVGAIAGVFVGILRYHERNDAVDERPARIDNMRKVAERENRPGYVMNHITAVTSLKPGRFRRLTLALSLLGIGKLVQHWFRPGFVLNMGTIHYARWFRLPGSDTLVFFSNYDGSWESYLEDFVTKAHKGQTAAWSNGKGFPRTSYLINGGADDGERFKRWVRRQQVPTGFWFSRFPDLTTDNIRNNALIHDGLMRVSTDTAAEAWLSCFASMPRAENMIQHQEVQGLVFRGFPHHQHSAVAAITLPEGAAARQAHGWLAKLERHVWFGDTGTGFYGPPTFIAFSAAGLEKLLQGFPDPDLLSSFPPAFRIGMANRANILRDTHHSEPGKWSWADAPDAAGGRPATDALLVIYGSSKDCEREMAEHRKMLEREFGKPGPGKSWRFDILQTQPTAKTAEAWKHGSQAIYEHFGFRDGISQPIIRGTQKSLRDAAPADLIEPGEMILGYRNNAGKLPPPITLPAEIDRSNDLPMEVPDFGTRFPRFGAARTVDLRDFGRNGTFLVVRQYQQHVEEFKSFLHAQAERLHKEPREHNLDKVVGCTIDHNWVASKLMGRTAEGDPLLGRATRRLDNDFNFGQDDPQGLRCPFGAHVRRANPRGGMQPDDPVEIEITKRHRILRRGRTYERPDPDKPGKTEKGLMFLALCADIERQFEFLQQTWLSSPAFQGLYNEPDPITATAPGGQFTIPTTAGPVTLKGLPNFVTVRAGGYFFMPSRSALSLLSSWTRRNIRIVAPKNPVVASSASCPMHPLCPSQRTAGA
jgi:cytochrome P450/deferrochelatase/peroxidase EfeB